MNCVRALYIPFTPTQQHLKIKRILCEFVIAATTGLFPSSSASLSRKFLSSFFARHNSIRVFSPLAPPSPIHSRRMGRLRSTESTANRLRCNGINFAATTNSVCNECIICIARAHQPNRNVKRSRKRKIESEWTKGTLLRTEQSLTTLCHVRHRFGLEKNGARAIKTRRWK